ncbi:uncharacterized protein spz6 isoform X2 [Centruroides vittatus]|uniref:uncharacterized protein spz6 isoform X2 n=1 Tax=Centruroides vittatus TaxID=120091 RepID=UPI0035109465
MYFYWIFIVFLCFHLLNAYSKIKAEYPEGYYAFEESTSIYKKPPKVRKPPYFKADVPCPGEDPIGRFSPRDTLCGDLNKGFIPRNPMGQTPFKEPYPFDVIKNKTLKFLARLLPYLKQDINIPKVARFVGAPISYREPGGYDYHQIPLQYHRNRRSVTDKTVTEETATTETSNVTSRGLCDDGSGILCSLSNALQSGKLPHTVLSVLAEVLSKTKTTTPKPETEDSKTNQILSLLAAIAENSIKKSPSSNTDEKTSNGEKSKDRSPLSHIMSIITGASSDDFSPVSLMIDLMANNHSPLSYLSNLFPVRRRRPTPPQGIDHHVVSETSKVEVGLPPTPCPSIEDYVTPTFARNYQGVWKYVVQIPSEGYFTQTVQQTKCVRNRCDFMEGVCHESPRWVSLLVAEVFYPNTYFPTSTPFTTSQNPYENEIPPVEDFSNFQQYLKRRVGETDRPTQPYPVFLHQKQTVSNVKETCDGYDQIGCYIIRVYYDWFLVNGSCKCWKPSARQLFKYDSGRSSKTGEENR